MKLLSKSDVDKAKAKDRQAEIAEGMKLAKRVDGLREVAAQEEAALMKFRHETLAEIVKEIAEKEEIRGTLKKEVRELEETKALLLQPLTAEEGRLEVKRTELEKAEEELRAKRRQLNEFSESLDIRERGIYSKEVAVESTHTLLKEKIKETDTLKGDTERKNRQIDEVLQNAQHEASILIENAQQQAKGVQLREEAVFKKEEELRTREIELENGWSLLRDRQKLKAKNKI